ncbi:Xylulose kinase [Raoultella planticola]|uniref:Xylulose kinase n=1 Tax=Raoultella planticola TaxID=575 RepID=A0A485AA02_RAOPL|nr:Xylulose kinase [Raoultella planticola]
MYLGIDLGTSEVKALVIDENNAVVASHSAPLTIQRPHPHWSEQAAAGMVGSHGISDSHAAGKMWPSLVRD